MALASILYSKCNGSMKIRRMYLNHEVLSFYSRKKNIFKLAQGEYIAPEKIENSYIRSQFISQCFIYGIPFTLMNLLEKVDCV